MVQDLSYNLCESLVENIGGVADIGKKTPPTPITYLTQWQIVGNSEVHTLPYPDGVVLPTGYKRCKYLEAHGTEYIELPIGFDNTDEVEMTVSFTQTNLSNKYAVAPKTWNDNNNRFGLGMHRTYEGDAFCIAYGTKGGVSFNNPIVAQDTNVHLFTYTNYLFKLDNSSTTDVSEFTFGGTTDNLRLFYGYNSPTKCRIYAYHQVKTNNTEINLIPCLDSNDTPCMYDVINNQAYYNSAGSGSFTYKLYPQPTEIWSCGEYNATDGKYHILVQPLRGSIVDIALDEPLRKVNNVVDKIEFPSETDGKALVTRALKTLDLGSITPDQTGTSRQGEFKWRYNKLGIKIVDNAVRGNILCAIFNTTHANATYSDRKTGISNALNGADAIMIFDEEYCSSGQAATFQAARNGVEVIYELNTPTTELVDAPQIAEAESYTCVISQGGRAVEWSSFSTD